MRILKLSMVWCMALAASGFAAEKTKIRIGVEDRSPPLSFTDAQGQPVGFAPELLREIEAASGIDFVVTAAPWSLILDDFRQGRLDALANVSITNERRATMDFSIGHAYVHGIAFQPEDAKPIQSIKDFGGKKLALVNGALLQMRATEDDNWGAQVFLYPSREAALKAVKSGECDFSLHLRPTRQMGEGDLGLRTHFVEDLHFKFHIAVHRGDHARLERINEGLAAVFQNRAFDRIYARWIGPIEARPISLSDLRPYLWPAVLAALLVAGILIWQQKVIADRRASGLKISRLNRVYATISRVNNAIVQIKDREQLLREICQVLVTEGCYKIAWIGWQGSDGQLQPEAVAGDDHGFVPHTHQSGAPDAAESQEPSSRCFRTGQTVVCDDLFADVTSASWHQLARAAGIASCIALPIKSEGRPAGVMVVYAGAKGFFSESEVALLAETATDLSFALDVLANEARRHESEAILKHVLDSIPQAIFWKDRQGVYLGCNAVFARYANLSRTEDAAGRTDFDFSKSQAEAERFRTEDQEIMRTREPRQHFVAWLRQPDGGFKWLDTAKVPLVNRAGQVYGILGVFEDVTDRKQTNDALLESRAQTLALINSTNDLIWSVDAENYGLTVYNQALADYFRKDRGIELRHGMTPAELLPPDFSRKWCEMYQKALRDGPFSIEYEVVSKARILSLSFNLIRRGDTTVGISVFGRDVSAQKQADLRLREQAALLDQAGDAIIVTQLDGRIKYWNSAAERLFGHARAALLGRNLAEIFPALTLDLLTQLEAKAPGASEWQHEIVLHDSAGRPLDMDLRISLATDAATRPNGRILIGTDITQRKKLQEQFLRAQRLESIGMLAAGIAHDLNNILAPIGMLSGILRRKLSDKSDERYLETLDTCTQRGTGLVRQILSFAHGITGEASVVQVKHLLRDIVQMITETFPKSIILDTHIPTDLWPIKCNPTQIHQVLLNLCVNARDAMPNGGTLTIRGENLTLDAEAAREIQGARPGNWLVLHLQDSGTGMPPEILARIWEPFFTTKGLDKGTGLGLPTVRGIIETHDGFINIETAVGSGTTFRVYLPVAEINAADDAREPSRKSGRGHGEAVLVADDEATIRDTTSALLASEGYRPFTASNGLEALKLLESRVSEFSLVITDQEMPILGGTELARTIRARFPHLKVLGISGSVGAAEILDANNKGLIDAFLPKPFTEHDLLATVEKLLRQNPTSA